MDVLTVAQRVGVVGFALRCWLPCALVSVPVSDSLVHSQSGHSFQLTKSEKPSCGIVQIDFRSRLLGGSSTRLVEGFGTSSS